MLFLNQSFLVLLKSLILDLFLSYELNGKLSSLIDDIGIRFLFSLTGSFSFHNLVKHNGAGINVLSFKQLFANSDLASDYRMCVQLQKFSDYQSHLGCHKSLLHHRVRSDVEVRFVKVLLCGPESTVILVFVILTIESFSQCLFLLNQVLKMLSRNHGIYMCNITQRSSHEGSQHLGVGEDVLIEGNWVIRVSQLGLTMGKHAPHPNRTSISGKPMPTEGGFVLLIENGVHTLITLYY